MFFFQAEAGIRGRDVTGVPTCALPIYGAMIAFAGCQRLVAGQHENLSFTAKPRWDLESLAAL